MISGAHMILYSTNPEADRAFFRDVLKLSSVDAGRGWLIFALPPSELAIHPAPEDGRHEIYLLCDKLEDSLSELDAHGISYAPPNELAWGRLTSLNLPGGGKLGLYQPKHALAHGDN